MNLLDRIHNLFNNKLNDNDIKYIADVLQTLQFSTLNITEELTEEEYKELFGDYNTNKTMLGIIDKISEKDYDKEDDLVIIQTWAFYFDKINKINPINQNNNQKITNFLVKINKLINNSTYKVKTVDEINKIDGVGGRGKTKKRKGKVGGKSKKKRGSRKR
jgi:hypothetical protein